MPGSRTRVQHHCAGSGHKSCRANDRRRHHRPIHRATCAASSKSTPIAKTATAEPGVIRDSLNREARDNTGLNSVPIPRPPTAVCWGGMIGNNSAGLYSPEIRFRFGSTSSGLKPYSTTAASLASARSQMRSSKQKPGCKPAKAIFYREMLRLLESNKEAIIQNYPHPEVVRRNTGYAQLDRAL